MDKTMEIAIVGERGDCKTCLVDYLQRSSTHVNQYMKNLWKVIIKQLKGTEKSLTNNKG